MNTDKIIVKCCICGREKTDQGWQYTFRINEPKHLYSHGFCSVCYDTEVMKAKLRQVTLVASVLR